MKVRIAALLACIALGGAAFSEGRIDLGILVPRGAGISMGGDTQTIGGLDVTNWPFIPIPDAGAYFVKTDGAWTYGIGARAFTMIVATIAWPNAFVEFNSDRLAIEAQVGGGAFAFLSVAGSNGGFGKVAIPDVSAWYKIGKNRNFRLGGGLIGLYLPELIGDGIPFLIYLGAKGTIAL